MLGSSASSLLGEVGGGIKIKNYDVNVRWHVCNGGRAKPL
jgi:hypothetical protein